MKYINKQTNFNGNEFTGYTYLFYDDTELTIDANGNIVDYSGIGFERAEKYAKQSNKKTN